MPGGPKTTYLCQECGYSSVRWLGKCPECGGWNTFFEEAAIRKGDRGGGPRPVGSAVTPLTSVAATAETRLATGIGELDQVLGGGVVVGSVILIGGEPGVGKTTILLQAMASLAGTGRKVLYVSGEESALQIRMRAERLGAVREDLLILVEGNLERIVEEIRNLRPAVVVIDSVQAVSSEWSPSPPGTIAQVRETAARIIALAKSEGISAFLVGHVTKEGSIAGPKVLEHMVDTVLYFESDTGHLFRIIRSSKNRYGSTNEVGIFQMGDDGLREVDNPSGLFLGQSDLAQPGTAVVPSLEGRRPILVEVQSLVSPAGYAAGRRSVSGLDLNRVIMLLAVLEKRAGLSFGASDVYASSSGGLRLVEPAADLGILLALASAHRMRPLPPRSAACGEVSLTGEVRAVSGEDLRVRELSRLGFRRCFLPESSRSRLKERPRGMELIFTHRVEDALEHIDS